MNAPPQTGADTGSQGDTPSPVGDSVNEINQADIDALLMAVGSDDNTAPGTAPADSADGGSELAPPAVDARVDSLGRPIDRADAAMQAAMDDEKRTGPTPAARQAPAVSVPPHAAGGAPVTQPFELAELRVPEGMNVDPKRVSMLHDVNLRVRIELGRTRMLVEDVLKLDEGSVVELDKLAGDPVDVLVNDRLIARGEVLVLNDNFCVRISEVLSHDPHRVSA
ncbi:MAG: flagellar motor switch protein FliN [Phycisphaerae bacterium]